MKKKIRSKLDGGSSWMEELSSTPTFKRARLHTLTHQHQYTHTHTHT